MLHKFRSTPLVQSCSMNWIMKLTPVGRLYSSFKDPYSVLGVGKNASAGDIKKAYFEVICCIDKYFIDSCLQMVKKYHPDTNKDPEAKSKFIEIQNAYEVPIFQPLLTITACRFCLMKSAKRCMTNMAPLPRRQMAVDRVVSVRVVSTLTRQISSGMSSAVAVVVSIWVI